MKIVVISDTHSGHLLGLTPPRYFKVDFELNDLMLNLWNWFISELPERPDYLIHLGDAIEGEGKKESCFHLTTDINKQIEIACDIIQLINAKKNIFVYGTPYHTGKIMDYERQIAARFGGDIAAKQKVSIGKIRFDLCHKIGKSGTPVGGDIQLRKAALWSAINDVLNEAGGRADYILRGHAHEYRLVENSLSSAIICPALKIGDENFDRYARGLDGYYNVGFLVFNIENGQVNMEKHFFQCKTAGGYREL